jgi:naphthalene 1,2-dioxygenase system ferredoxin subunit
MGADWIDAASVEDLWEDAGFSVIAGGREYALFKAEGAVYATDSHCTHGHARLCEGFVEGHEVECPLHQGRFDLRTGQPTCPPVTQAVKTYPVRIQGGRVFLSLN